MHRSSFTSIKGGQPQGLVKSVSTIFNNNNVSSRKVAVVSPEVPRAVVIIFGWSGAYPQTLRMYEELYHENAIATVSCIPPIICTANNLSKLALDVGEEAVRVVRRSEGRQKSYSRKSIPVFTHVFSNGGSLLLEQLEIKLLNAEAYSNNLDKSRNIDTIENGLDNISLDESLAPSLRRRLSFRDPNPFSNKHASASAAPSSKTLETVDTLQFKPRWWQIKKRKENIKSQNIKNTASENLREKNLFFLSKRLKLGAQIFDSAPCFHNNITLAGLKAITDACSQAVAQRYGPLIRNHISQSTLQPQLQCSGRRPSDSSTNTNNSDAQSNISDISSFSTVSQKLRWKRKSNWNYFETSNICNRQLFIYSEADKYTHAGKLEELILKKQCLGVQVYVLKFHDSPHIQHFLRYTEEYEIFISSAIDTICGEKKEEEWINNDNNNDSNICNKSNGKTSLSFQTRSSSSRSVYDHLELEEDSVCDTSMIQKMQCMSSNYDI